MNKTTNLHSIFAKIRSRSLWPIVPVAALVTASALTGISCAAPPTTATSSAATNSTSTALPNLAEPPAKPRFKVTDRVWPEKAGEAAICLWNDDKLAAFSITIDDNSAPDVDWWLGKSKEVNLSLTWFIITGRVGGGNAFWGDWALWNRVRAAGHAVESHTVTHLHVDEPGWKGIEWEYAD
ncbi:MAG: polysaccharide deacetylase family protein, partial [Armatimonadota bacterium]|nr:polysaccharide deacetylase family protein [Armatimonadota bacterium]